jgi:transposase
MPAIQAPDRQQFTFTGKLDDLVGPDHPVRLLNALIDRIIEADPDFFGHLAPKGSVGRGGYPATALIKLYMYGYIHGISSSRKLQAEAERNIEVIWLLSTLQPSYKTIADYRKDYPDQIECVNEAVTQFLINGGWIKGERVAIDGAKLKAYTGWDMPDEQALERRLEKAHRKLEEWLNRLTLNDALEDAEQVLSESGPQDRPNREAAIMGKIEKLHGQIDKLEAGRDRCEAAVPKRDPQARAMRAPHGRKPPAYNLQVGVDSENGMIVAASITNAPNDFEQLLPMHQAVSKQLGKPPDEVLADTGYADLGDIKHIQTETSTRCYIPENDTPVANRDIQFTYEPEADRYRCSAGRILKPIAKERYRKDKEAYVDLYRGVDCQGCPLQDECTSAADGVRQVSVFHGAKWRHQYARQMDSRYGKSRSKERKTIVEHVFGSLRYLMGQIPLWLRGLRKVQTERDLYAAGYNLKRWFKLGKFNELKKEITDWSPALNPQPGLANT